MSKLRAFLIVLTILAMAAAPMLVPVVGLGSSNSTSVFAAPAAAPASDNHDDDDDDDDNDDGDNDDDGDDNDNNDDGDDNDNNDDDDGDDNDNMNVDVPAPPAPAAPPAPVCSTPGQEMAFQTNDGRITVRVFSSLTQSVKFSIRHPVDPASVPPAPGPVVGGLLFQLVAETCDGSPIPVLPAEVNLGVRYLDGEAAGLNEANFTLARLDTSANQWRQVEKQATDPPNNYTSATIRDMGFYVLYQRS